ncbi:hypothetical protein Arnit_0165 [Arcobacter nitrofigilis DSM 7299]|uniref:Periplasmic protein n=1 Tax=Arcobacter nitrofigilis (strain ATCC 33309 / DSM 7299 / CCUG 15893 / LMG 7604 / NCTC 12251 / CI) TaxID=572480 RepID=D5V499_ARCNC|nr:hypothetical protein [Arcobacter nitrofigilis]ADG91832.1 hypothetical protein Arnit_0165 [Arcobacter nitrofigilis DSM 7299]
MKKLIMLVAALLFTVGVAFADGKTGSCGAGKCGDSSKSMMKKGMSSKEMKKAGSCGTGKCGDSKKDMMKKDHMKGDMMKKSGNKASGSCGAGKCGDSKMKKDMK